MVDKAGELGITNQGSKRENQHTAQTPVQIEPVASKISRVNDSFINSISRITNPDIRKGLEKMQQRDWIKELDGHSGEGPYRPEEAVQLLLIANLGQEEVVQWILKTFGNIASAQRLRQEINRKKFEADPKDMGAKRGSEYISPIIAAQLAEFERMQLNPEYAYQWYEEARRAIGEAKQAVSISVGETDETLKQILGGLRFSPWLGVRDRMVIATPLEYQELLDAMYGHSDFTWQMGKNTGGHVTMPRLGQPRAGISKINIKLVQKDPDNPEAGVRIECDTTLPIKVARHEGIHLITDSQNEEFDVDKRGFRNFTANAISENESLSRLPQIAMDEGAVAFLEEYIDNGQDIDRVFKALEAHSQIGDNLAMHPAYTEATIETAKRVKETGFDTFAKAYINNDVDSWLAALDGKVDSYLQTMSKLQPEIVAHHLLSH